MFRDRSTLFGGGFVDHHHLFTSARLLFIRMDGHVCVCNSESQQYVVVVWKVKPTDRSLLLEWGWRNGKNINNRTRIHSHTYLAFQDQI